MKRCSVENMEDFVPLNEQQRKVKADLEALIVPMKRELAAMKARESEGYLGPTEAEPQAESYADQKRLAAMREELRAIETLEYHNKNWLHLDNAQRSAEKRALLSEAILLTGQRTDVSRFT